MHAAAVLLGDLAHDRQPEPGAGAPARGRAAVEAVEEVWKVVGVDAGAVIADAHTVSVDPDLDDPARRGVLGGVVEQIVDGAGEALARALHHDGSSAASKCTLGA